MHTGGSKIKLGQVSGALKGDESPSGGEPSQANREQPVVGYSLGANRPEGDNDVESNAKEPLVRPWILYATVGAAVLLLVSFVFGTGSIAKLSFDNDTTLKKYEKYLETRKDGGMPTVEEIRRKLIAIAFLENTERASEARVSWRQLVLSAKGDSKNPIYQLAIKHLEGAP